MPMYTTCKGTGQLINCIENCYNGEKRYQSDLTILQSVQYSLIYLRKLPNILHLQREFKNILQSFCHHSTERNTSTSSVVVKICFTLSCCAGRQGIWGMWTYLPRGKQIYMWRTYHIFLYTVFYSSWSIIRTVREETKKAFFILRYLQVWKLMD